jgi:predicted GH43/DUF377 family glycosyl hydrolase
MEYRTGFFSLSPHPRMGIEICLVVLCIIAAIAACPSQAQTDWTKHAGNPVLNPGDAGQWDDKTVGEPGVILENGTYKMWYVGQSGDNAYTIGYATSPDGVNWTRDAGNPVLSTGSWDDTNVKDPWVILEDGTYKMWYTGSTGAYPYHRIGYASSPDGVNWAKSASYVLEGTPGDWDSYYVEDPCVILDGGIYKMWYRGSDGSASKICYATSPDGINWTKHPSSPVLSLGVSGEWDDVGLTSPIVVLDGGIYAMWYTGGDGSTNRVGYATSSDGINWTKHASNPVMEGTAGEWDAALGTIASTVLLDDQTYRMWYWGLVGQGLRIGYATSVQPIVVVSPQRNATSVAPDAPVTVEFSADMNPATIALETFAVRGEASGPKTGVVTYSGGSRTATFTPSTPFLAGERVFVQLTPGILSAEGAALANGYAFSFRIKTEGTGGIQLSRADEWTTPSSIMGPVVGDLNGDSRLDLFMGLSTFGYRTMLFGASGPTITDVATTIIGGVPRLADFNGDGDLDVVGIHDYDPIFLQNDGSGGFSAPIPFSTPYYYSWGEAADLDADGDIDLLMNAYNQNPVHEIHSYLNDGNGNFTHVHSAPGSSGLQLATIDDINGDGLVDVVAPEHYTNPGVNTWLGEGGGAFAAPTFYSRGIITNFGIRLEDMDGDGDLDYPVGQGNEGLLSVLMNDGNGSFSTGQTLTGIPYPSGMKPADMDGNGTIDLVYHSYEAGKSLVVLGNDGSTLSVDTIIPLTDGGYPSTFLAVGDIDADGDIDAFVGKDGAPAYWKLILFENESAPTAVAVSLPHVTASYLASLTLPVQVENAAGQGIVSAEVFLSYDSSLLTFNGVQTQGTLTAGWTIEDHLVDGSGDMKILRIAAATDNLEITADGTLLEVQFTMKDVRVPASSPLTLDHVLFNDGTPANTTTDGSVTLVGVDGVLTSSPETIIPRQTITVTVIDADADLDGAPDNDQVTVMVASSNGDEETLTLEEDAVTAGTFSETIPTVFGTTENDGDDQVQAQDGDQITFTYADALATDGTGPHDRSDQTVVVGGTDGTVDISIGSQPGDAVYIKVVDADVSTPPLDYTPAATTIDVDVTSSTTAVLTVTLDETGVGSGVFVGALATTSGTETGQMTIAEEDVLTVTYVDDLGGAGEPPTDRTDDNLVLDPWGDADDNDQPQAYDAAMVLLEVLDDQTLSGLPELAANVDIDPVGTGLTPFDASLILQYRVGIITSFPVQDPTSTNHPQPNPASPKLIPEERLLALQMHDGYVSVWMEERSGIVAGDLRIEGMNGTAEMAEELRDFLSLSRATGEGLRVVFAGADDVSGPGELLRIYGVGPVRAQLTRADLNDGSIVARIGEGVPVSTPSAFALHPNHPNPFNPETTIRYDLPEAGTVSLRIYDVTGQVVREFVHESQMPGSYRVVWDGRDREGVRVGNGLYLYELRSGSNRAMCKMILMK